MSEEEAEIAAAFVVRSVRRLASARWIGGARPSPIGASPPRAPHVDLIASRQIRGLPEAAARALVGWAEGTRDVSLLRHVPAPREVLACQARARRCVSLLPDDAAAAPHAHPLAFAIHDLCHLEKLFEPEHHAGQVGFFHACERALEHRRWAEIEAALDRTWPAERDHVLSDMNGSAVFLFLALKTKLRLAVRRRVAEDTGAPPPTGPLEAREQRRFREVFEGLLDAFEAPPDVRPSARLVACRADAEIAGATLLAWFEAIAVEGPLTARRGATSDVRSS